MQRPIRVLNVLSYYAPHISGLTEAVRLGAERIAATDAFRVTVLAMRHDKLLPQREIIRNVDVVRAKTLLALHKGFLSLDLFRHYRNLVKAADIVHLHLPMLEAGALSFMTPSRIPLLASWYCDLAPSRRFSVLDRLAVRTVQSSSRLACVRSERICVLSEDYAAGSDFLRGFETKLAVVFPPDNAPEDLEPKCDGRTNAPRQVGFLGRFAEEKGLDVLLDAAAMVTRERPDVTFVLAGDYEGVAGGTEYHRLREKIERLGKSVILTGKLPYDKLWDFYRSLDAFVLPSVNAYEAFGIVQVEAMKAGVPVIASDLRGVRVPVQTTGSGVLVPPGDAAAFAKAILDVLARPPASSSAIAARAWQHYSTKATANRLMAIYRELYRLNGV